MNRTAWQPSVAGLRHVVAAILFDDGSVWVDWRCKQCGHVSGARMETEPGDDVAALVAACDGPMLCDDCAAEYARREEAYGDPRETAWRDEEG